MVMIMSICKRVWLIDWSEKFRDNGFWSRSTRVVHCRQAWARTCSTYWWRDSREFVGKSARTRKQMTKRWQNKATVPFHSDAAAFIAASTSWCWSSVCETLTSFSAYYVTLKQIPQAITHKLYAVSVHVGTLLTDCYFPLLIMDIEWAIIVEACVHIWSLVYSNVLAGPKLFG